MQVNIRISDNLYSKLREVAKKNHRTITGQLEEILCNVLEVKEDTTIETTNKPNRNIIENTEKDLNQEWAGWSDDKLW